MPAPTDADRHARSFRIFARAIELPGDVREAYVREACGADPGLAALVTGMLAVDGAASPLDDDLESMLNPPADELVGTTIGSWTLVAELGRGGMGVVYDAVRSEHGFVQRAALKRVRGSANDAALRRRLAQERAILARLEHPNIARLLDGGVTAQGEPWFAMERIDGLTLTEHARRHRLGLRERLGLVLQVCAAVDYLHRNLVLHRDIKPSNLLVDAHGRVRLLDFGIATLTDDEPTATTVHALTPHYAAPEQLRGEPVSTATDGYAIGLVLYELLCGRRAFPDAGSALASLQARSRQPEPPRLTQQIAVAGAPPLPVAELRRALRGDLERIVATAIDARPQSRYASVQALADDLHRYLDGFPVHARAGGPVYRARKFIRRHRLAIAAAALSVVIAVTGVAATLAQAERARHEAGRAEAVNRFLLDLLTAADPWRNDRSPPNVVELARDAFAQVDARFAAQPIARRDIHRALGRVFSVNGETALAVRAAAAAAAVSRSQRDLPGLARDLVAVGSYAGYHGDYRQQAQAIAELELLASPALRREVPELDMSLAGIRTYLAVAHGRPQAALTAARESLAAVRRMPGATELQRADAHYQIARILAFDLGRCDAAAAEMGSALPLWRSARPAARAWVQIAGLAILSDCMAADEVLLLIARNRALIELGFGPRSPYAVAARYFHARALRGSGQISAALTLAADPGDIATAEHDPSVEMLQRLLEIAVLQYEAADAGAARRALDAVTAHPASGVHAPSARTARLLRGLLASDPVAVEVAMREMQQADDVDAPLALLWAAQLYQRSGRVADAAAALQQAATALRQRHRVGPLLARIEAAREPAAAVSPISAHPDVLALLERLRADTAALETAANAAAVPGR